MIRRTASRAATTIAVLACAINYTGAATILTSPVSTGNDSFVPCASIGDVTGDGIPDIVAAAPNSGSGADHVVLFSGADNSVVYQVGPDPGYFGFGYSIRPLGNYGGAATADFAAAANAGGNGGAIFILEGATGAILNRIDAPVGDTSFDFGTQFFVSNVTGTSTLDFIVGSAYGGTNGGHFFVYDGSTRSLVATIEPPTSETDQAFTVYSMLPDLNGDGVEEIGAAAPFLDHSGKTNAGRAYIFSGINRTLYRTITLASPQNNDQLTGPYPLGDLNGDGKSDYSCGYGTTPATANAIIYSGLDGSVIATIPSPDANASDFGRYVVGVSDISGDGVNEIVIGCANAGASFGGAVFIYNGATRALITSFGNPTATSGTDFGTGISLIGDIDADGKQDLAIPAPYQGDGRMYIYTHAGRPAFTTPGFGLGEFKVGTSYAALTPSLLNLGLSTLSLSSLAVSGGDASSFTLSTNPAPTSLTASQSVNFGITPTPSTPGIKSATITANGSNGSTGTAILSLEAYDRPTGPDERLAYLAGENRVMLIDTVNGNRDIISGAGVGTGPVFTSGFSPKVTDVLIEDSTNLIVSAGYKFYRVDRNTGARTELNAAPIADGLGFTSDNIVAMEWETPGVLIALISGSVSRLTRLTLSGMTAQVVSSSSVGSGPTFYTYGSDLLAESSTSMLVSDFSGQSVIRVDTTTGNRTKLNSATLPYATSIARFSANEVVLGEFSGITRVNKFNLDTNAYGTISSPSGYSLYVVGAMGVYDDGTILVFDCGNSALIRVNSLTGAKTVVATTSTGLGPNLPNAFYSDGAGMRLLSTAAPVSGASSWNRYE